MSPTSIDVGVALAVSAPSTWQPPVVIAGSVGQPSWLSSPKPSPSASASHVAATASRTDAEVVVDPLIGPAG